ncbi:polysaccharide deacetylase family protein [Gymnodinialimonas sp. 2305UL16-5]|uniref:polysaccharide deacetylase family protein n=1 Tax=Gymnodinialimonas mytili TaxID=3126503 RepID=UPI003097FCB5
MALGLLVGAAYQISRARDFQLFGEIITHGPRDMPQIALTFDDGPTARHTPALLQALADGDAVATFFLVGRDIDANPEAAAAIIEAGHEVGNHSWDHPRMVLMSPAAIREQIIRTDATIRDLGYEGPIQFRPPFGKKLVVLPWILREMGRPTVMWSVEPETLLGADAEANDIAIHVVEQAEAGDIILLHGMFSTNQATRDALPEIITGLRERGFEFVRVSDLIDPADD